MRRLLLLASCLLTLASNGQGTLPEVKEETNEKLRFDNLPPDYVYTVLFTIGYGRNAALTDPYINAPTDEIVAATYTSHDMVFSAEASFNHGRGLLAFFELNGSLDKRYDEDRFESALESYYPDFAVRTTDVIEPEDNNNQGSAAESPTTAQFIVGGGYQIIKDDLAIAVRGGYVFSDHSNIESVSVLKELNSNRFHRFSYLIDGDSNSSYGHGYRMEFRLMYNLGGTLYAYGKASFGRTWHNFSYLESRVDLYNNTRTITEYEYNKSLDYYNFSFGIAMGF